MSVGLNVAITNTIFCSLFSYALAPFVNFLGIKFNIVDLPNLRKVHKKPIVRIGGLTIFSVFSLYLLFTTFFIKIETFDSQVFSKFCIFLLGGLLFFLIGIHDDIFKSSPLLRLFLQFIVAFFVAFGGINFGAMNFYLPFIGEFTMVMPPALNYIFSAFWIVGTTNSINWLDGIDALAGGYCSILSIGLCANMLYQENYIGVLFFSIILGSIFGFLIRNFKPAFYIMGDCGSNFLGYCFAAGSVLFLPNKIDGSINIIYLLVIFSLPLGDMVLVIFERLLKNNNIFLPDKNHIHHRLMNLNLNYNQIIFLLFSYSTFSISLGLFFLK